MIKKTVVVYLALSLSGCFLGDHFTPSADAEASFVGGDFCLTTPGRTEKQKLIGMSVEKVGESPGSSTFFKSEDEYITIKKDTCIPTFGYKFEVGSAYNVSIYLTKDPERDESNFYTNNYTTSFVIWETSKKDKRISYL
ncbi:putative T6SS immunity periplasmic lipoprotein [Rahnella bruchi]|uniref:putative T6SS immunity periplasmic lipoprotein n=1 Tax=Rahnella bruchi TaxID=1510573 RepID=UPI000EA06F83|nr:putative T6SS immunity periplasmic lipoprotein [Rahnella bruchi]